MRLQSYVAIGLLAATTAACGGSNDDATSPPGRGGGAGKGGASLGGASGRGGAAGTTSAGSGGTGSGAGGNAAGQGGVSSGGTSQAGGSGQAAGAAGSTGGAGPVAGASGNGGLAGGGAGSGGDPSAAGGAPVAGQGGGGTGAAAGQGGAGSVVEALVPCSGNPQAGEATSHFLATAGVAWSWERTGAGSVVAGFAASTLPTEVFEACGLALPVGEKYLRVLALVDDTGACAWVKRLPNGAEEVGSQGASTVVAGGASITLLVPTATGAIAQRYDDQGQPTTSTSYALGERLTASKAVALSDGSIAAIATGFAGTPALHLLRPDGTSTALVGASASSSFPVRPVLAALPNGGVAFAVEGYLAIVQGGKVVFGGNVLPYGSARALATSPAGDIVIAGVGSVYTGAPGQIGPRRAFVARFGLDGRPRWYRPFEQQEKCCTAGVPFEITGVDVEADDRTVVTGHWFGEKIVTPHETTRGACEAPTPKSYVAELAPDGSFLTEAEPQALVGVARTPEASPGPLFGFARVGASVRGLFAKPDGTPRWLSLPVGATVPPIAALPWVPPTAWPVPAAVDGRQTYLGAVPIALAANGEIVLDRKAVTPFAGFAETECGLVTTVRDHYLQRLGADRSCKWTRPLEGFSGEHDETGALVLAGTLGTLGQTTSPTTLLGDPLGALLVGEETREGGIVAKLDAQGRTVSAMGRSYAHVLLAPGAKRFGARSFIPPGTSVRDVGTGDALFDTPLTPTANDMRVGAGAHLATLTLLPSEIVVSTATAQHKSKSFGNIGSLYLHSVDASGRVLVTFSDPPAPLDFGLGPRTKGGLVLLSPKAEVLWDAPHAFATAYDAKRDRWVIASDRRFAPGAQLADGWTTEPPACPGCISFNDLSADGILTPRGEIPGDAAGVSRLLASEGWLALSSLASWARQGESCGPGSATCFATNVFSFPLPP